MEIDKLGKMAQPRMAGLVGCRKDGPLPGVWICSGKGKAGVGSVGL